MPRFEPDDLARWADGQWTTPPVAPVTGVTHDTRSIRRGDLFVAFRGARVDGHALVGEALARGAVAAVVERGRDGLPDGAALLAVADTAAALRGLAAGYRASLPAAIVGVTGSTGKTTVKELIADLLATELQTARTRGNWNNEIGLPLSLLTLDATDRAGVFEVGISHPGEMAPLADVLRPDWAVVTNVGPVHLEFFPSVAAIAGEKAELLRHLPPSGGAVLNADAPGFALLRERAPGRVVTVATAAAADYRCAPEPAAGGDWVVTERATGTNFAFRTPLPGRHQRDNALLAIAVARQFGVGWDNIRAALTHYVTLPLRWECRTVNGVLLVNDAYNANPMSMRAALAALRETPAAAGRWLVLGDMLELGDAAEAEHAALGRLAAADDWAGLVTLGERGALIADGAAAGGFAAERIRRCRTADEAADWLAARVRPGAAVLFKASRGMRLEQVAEGLSARLTPASGARR